MAKSDAVKTSSVEDLVLLMLAMQQTGVSSLEFGDVKIGLGRPNSASAAASSIAQPQPTIKQAMDAVAASRVEAERQRLSKLSNLRQGASGGISTGSPASAVQEVYKEAMRTRPSTQPLPTEQPVSGG